MKVFISSGPRTFHLKYLIHGFDSINLSYRFLVGLNFNHSIIRKVHKYIPDSINQSIQSFSIHSKFISTCFSGELTARLSTFFRAKKYLIHLSSFFSYFSHYLFALKASILLSHDDYDVFHCRSSFAIFNFTGQKKYIKLCDHSIANPLIISQLIKFKGDLRASKELPLARLKPHERMAFFDLANSDHIVVNSQFVKETLMYSSIPENKISVIELSISNNTLETAKSFDEILNTSPPNELLYAGSWSERKGVDTLVNSLALLPESVTINVAGTTNNTFKNSSFKHRIRGLGYLTQSNLLRLLTRIPIFVFPTYCEGFAKTIQEALACGCYVITTLNSGFSVNHGFYATLIKPGCEEELSNAIINAINDPNIYDKGLANRKLARKVYHPELYSQNMSRLYSSLIASKKVA